MLANLTHWPADPFPHPGDGGRRYCVGLPSALAYALMTHMNYIALTRLQSQDPMRKWTAAATLVFLVSYPLSAMDPGRPVVMFTLASATFMLTLRVYDVYFTRPGSVWRDLPYGRYLVELFSFPVKVLTTPTPNTPELLRRKQQPTDAVLKKSGTNLQLKRSKSNDCLQREAVTSAMLALQIMRGIGYLYLAHVVLVFIPSSSEVINEKSWTKSYFNYTLMASAFYCILGSISSTLGAVLSYLGYPQLRMFNNPFFSTSPKMFWSERWNMAVKSLLHRVIFNMRNRRLLFGTPGNQRMSNLEKAFWAMVVFIISGLYHEYITYVVFGMADGMNMIFFSLHGIVTIFQVLLQKSVPILRNVPAYVAYPINFAFFTATSPMFFNVYVKGRIFETSKVDNPTYDLAVRSVDFLRKALPA